jgi:hypothetical protein
MVPECHHIKTSGEKGDVSALRGAGITPQQNQEFSSDQALQPIENK